MGFQKSKLTAAMEEEITRRVNAKISDLTEREKRLEALRVELTAKETKLAEERNKLYNERDKQEREASASKHFTELGKAVEEYHIQMNKMHERTSKDNPLVRDMECFMSMVMGPYGRRRW